MDSDSAQMAPRTLGLSMVKNEEDIVEPFVRHNAGLLDIFVVLDNGSVDRTRSILIDLARELGNVIVTDASRFGYHQSARMTGLLRTAQSSVFADFVFFIDADEFIGATSRTALHQQLARIPSGAFGAMAWQNFIVPADDLSGDPPRSMTERRAEEAMQNLKVILRLDGALRSDVSIGTGNHDVTSNGVPMTGVFLHGLPLWHFPIRSRDQLTAKALVGWMACLTENPRAAETRVSYHWGDMSRRIAWGEGFAGEELRKLSLHYADVSYSLNAPQPPDPPVVTAPAPIEYHRKYSTGSPLDPLTLVARSWEQALKAETPLLDPEAFPGASFDVPPLRFLVEKHSPASVLHLQCALGLHIEVCARLGIEDLAGVGRLPADAMLTRHGGYFQGDETSPFTLSRRFGLVLCLEAAVPPASAEARFLVGNAARHAEDLVLFSAADASEGPLRAWLEHWRDEGFVPDLVDTLGARCLSSRAADHRGLVVLRRPDARGVTDATQDLLKIASRPYRTLPVPAQIYNELALGAKDHWIGYEPEGEERG